MNRTAQHFVRQFVGVVIMSLTPVVLTAFAISADLSQQAAHAAAAPAQAAPRHMT